MEFELGKTREILRQTPATVTSLLKDLSDEWLFANEGGESWSAFDIVGHLIHGEKTDWIPRMRIILEHGESRPFDEFDRFAQKKESKGKTLPELLNTFAALRKKNIEILDQTEITPETLMLHGTHPEFGAVSLSQLLSTWAVHDLGHIAQISRVLCRQYREAVGPWKEYLPLAG